MTASSNPFVDYLNSLRTRDGASNPNYVEENRAEYLDRLRAAHPWFPAEPDLRVRTRVSSLVEAMCRPDFPLALVILTGDAGDGKTAACVDLARTGGLHRPLKPIDRAAGWEIIKDASENAEEEVASTMETARQSGGRLLVAINEGRLRRLRSVPALADIWKSVIEPALSAWIDAEDAVRLDAEMRRHRVGVVNFRHRMHVRTVSPSLFEVWTNPSYWDEASCGGCEVRSRCPIYANVQSLRSRETVGRVTDVLAMAHFSGQRLPFRRLQGMLAFAITGGLGCRDVTGGRAPQLADRFYSLLFQREVRGDARPEPVARVLAPADPGIRVDARTDARAAAWLGGDVASLPAFEVQAFPAASEADNMRALRRFDALAGEGADGASWRRALSLLERYAAQDEANPLREAVVRGLNALHRLDTPLVSVLTDQQMEPAAFRDPARATLELSLGSRFVVELNRGPVLPAIVDGWLESCPADIDLVAWPEHESRPPKPARLRLDARLVALLLDVDAGYQFLPALGAYRRELARFHAHLLSLVGPTRVAVTLRSGRRVWTLVPTGDRIRFDGHG